MATEKTSPTTLSGRPDRPGHRAELIGTAVVLVAVIGFVAFALAVYVLGAPLSIREIFRFFTRPSSKWVADLLHLGIGFAAGFIVWWAGRYSPYLFWTLLVIVLGAMAFKEFWFDIQIEKDTVLGSSIDLFQWYVGTLLGLVVGRAALPARKASN